MYMYMYFDEVRATFSQSWSHTFQLYNNLVSCFRLVSRSQISWGDSEKSPALQDVLHHMNDITALWIETQNEYIGE